MIKSILNKLGYIHESEVTEEFLGLKYGEIIGDTSDYGIETKEEKDFFIDFSRIESASEFLKATAAKDMQRYFAATDEKQRDMARGAFARTVYFRAQLSKSRDEGREASVLNNPRYSE